MTFEERYEKVKDPQTLSARLGIKNVAKYFRDSVLNNPDQEEAEINMQALEGFNNIVEAERLANEYKRKRQEEYNDSLLLEALAEKEMGRQQKMADYIIHRQEIQSKYPKGE